MKTEIPSNTGYSYQYQNFGKTSNKGVELQMNAILVQNKNFNLDFNFNIAWNKNRIDELPIDNPWQSSNWSGSTISKYEDYRVEKEVASVKYGDLKPMVITRHTMRLTTLTEN